MSKHVSRRSIILKQPFLKSNCAYTILTQPLQRLKMCLSTSIPSSHLSPACQNRRTICLPCSTSHSRWQTTCMQHPPSSHSCFESQKLLFEHLPSSQSLHRSKHVHQTSTIFTQQQTCFDIRKGCVRMVDVQETRFDIRKGCVTWLRVWYMRFHHWRGCVRMVDILETNFVCRKAPSSHSHCRGDNTFTECLPSSHRHWSG